jgi:hypothetical protein
MIGLMRTSGMVVIGGAFVVVGVLLGAIVDGDWYFRLIPLGVGLAGGALLMRTGRTRS